MCHFKTESKQWMQSALGSVMLTKCISMHLFGNVTFLILFFVIDSTANTCSPIDDSSMFMRSSGAEDANRVYALSVPLLPRMKCRLSIARKLGERVFGFKRTRSLGVSAAVLALSDF